MTIIPYKNNALSYFFLSLILLFGLLSGCASQQNLKSNHLNFANLTQSVDPSYGYSPQNPINVGGGPERQHQFLNALAGPNGETITYTRLGSCCEFEDPTLPFGGGLLDLYELYYSGQKQPIQLYLNFYHKAETLYVPVGLTAK